MFSSVLPIIAARLIFSAIQTQPLWLVRVIAPPSGLSLHCRLLWGREEGRKAILPLARKASPQAGGKGKGNPSLELSSQSLRLKGHRVLL